jgi:hypothetical protein
MGYESFLMDIGMYGNPFDLDYTQFSFLATSGTWFKNVWELLTNLDVSANTRQRLPSPTGTPWRLVNHV